MDEPSRGLEVGDGLCLLCMFVVDVVNERHIETLRREKYDFIRLGDL